MPVRSQLTHALVECDGTYADAGGGEPWTDWYAARIVERFG